MDYRCRLDSLGNSSTASGSSDSGARLARDVVRPSGPFFQSHCTSSFHIYSTFLTFSHFLFHPMRKCVGKHSCLSSSFSIAILNGILFFFRKAKLPSLLL